ncbi:MAG: alpha/beta fold hydrolase [Spirochaetales bacterium]
MIRTLERKPLEPSTGKAPLLVFLHGFGSNEADLFGLAEAFDPRFHVLSLRAPMTLSPQSFAWFMVDFTPEGPQHDEAAATKSLGLLVEFLETARKTLPIEASQVYLVGFSQGAILATSVLLTRPDLVAGVVAWSGRTLPEVVPTAPGPAALADKPILVVHGTEDRTLPIHHGRATREALAKLPVELTYQEFAMGHEVTDESLEFTRDWMNSRVK